MFELHDPTSVAFAVSEIQGWLSVKLRTGRASFGLVAELAFHMLNRIYDVHTIYDEIGMLEENDPRISSAKGAHQFKHQPLRGLWCKHHHQTNFLMANLMLEMNRASTVDSFLKNHIGEVMTQELIQNLVHELVLKNHHRRASEKRLTGEWIVYERVDDKNYYLTLGHHEEGDDRIKERVDAYRWLDANMANSSILIAQRQ